MNERHLLLAALLALSAPAHASGGAVPQITSFSPKEAPAVFAYQEDFITMHGTNLNAVTDVHVNGHSLGGLPPLWTQVSNTEIRFQFPLLDSLGPATVRVIGPGGGDSATLNVVPPSPPALRLNLGKTPELLVSLLDSTFTVGGPPGDIAFLFGSTSSTPSVIPGVLDLDIGAQFTGLALLETLTIGRAGWAQFAVKIPSTANGVPLYFQSFVYDPETGALPVESTNVSEGFQLF